MYSNEWLQGTVAFFAALVVGTFVEYWGHRLMHAGKLFGKRHMKHHRIGLGQGWYGEFKAYLIPGPFILGVGFLYSVAAGIGFAIGGTVYAAFAAYSHQIQHESPELVFWLPQPIHYLHHKLNMWQHNFGISVDIWDRVFRTYKVVEWNPGKRPFDHPLSRFFQIQWIRDREREWEAQ